MSSSGIVIRKSTVHGDSLVAQAACPAGELCFEERILFSVPIDMLAGPPATRADSMLSMQQLDEAPVEEAIRKSGMSVGELRELETFSGSSNLNRFQISSYDMCPVWSQVPVAFGYGRYGSYLNHSCKPNLLYFWDAQRQQMQLRALSEIKPGDELTLDYLATEEWLTRDQRWQDLDRLLKLEDCACDKCKGSDQQESDARISKIKEVETTLTEFLRSGAEMLEPTDLVQHYIKLAVNEVQGDNDPEASRVEPRLAIAYRLASLALDKAGHNEEARVRSDQADKVAEMCFGQGDANIFQQEKRLKQRLGMT